MKIKNIIISLICIITICFVGMYNKKIVNKISPLLKNTPAVVLEKQNNYYRNNNYTFVQNTKNFVPYGYQDLLNIIYTILNSGWEQTTFYCPEEYEECIHDLESISLDNILLTNINDYVHPYNNFFTMKTTYNSTGEATITIIKLYNSEKVRVLENKVDEIIKNEINENMSNEEKIQKIHDYIIKNTSYDILRNETGISTYDSNTAYGVLLQGYGVCGGYSDAMAIFLNRFKIDNFKVSAENHVWNAVYLNNKWYHLDLTWDDPVTSSGDELLLQKYFLIDSKELKASDTKSHNFNHLIYQEFK